jgi:hypothetical protein
MPDQTSRTIFESAMRGLACIRDHCGYFRHLPNKRFAQKQFNGSRASTSDKRRAVVMIDGKYAMFVDRINSCPYRKSNPLAVARESGDAAARC